jgi:hypothetical protein
MDLGEGEAPLVEAPAHYSSYGEEGPLSETQTVGSTHLPINCRTDDTFRVRFPTTVGEEPQVEVGLI